MKRASRARPSPSASARWKVPNLGPGGPDSPVLRLRLAHERPRLLGLGRVGGQCVPCCRAPSVSPRSRRTNLAPRRSPRSRRVSSSPPMVCALGGCTNEHGASVVRRHEGERALAANGLAGPSGLVKSRTRARPRRCETRIGPRSPVPRSTAARHRHQAGHGAVEAWLGRWHTPRTAWRDWAALRCRPTCSRTEHAARDDRVSAAAEAPAVGSRLSAERVGQADPVSGRRPPMAGGPRALPAADRIEEACSRTRAHRRLRPLSAGERELDRVPGDPSWLSAPRVEDLLALGSTRKTIGCERCVDLSLGSIVLAKRSAALRVLWPGAASVSRPGTRPENGAQTCPVPPRLDEREARSRPISPFGTHEQASWRSGSSWVGTFCGPVVFLGAR